MWLLTLLLLLTLPWSQTGGQEPAVQVSCVAMETCLLPCSFPTKEVLFQIEWFTGEKKLVHSYKEGKDEPDKQDVDFRGRTSIFPQQIAGGNGSLLLSSVRPADQGTFLCQVFTKTQTGLDTTQKWVNLTVEGPVRAVVLELEEDVLNCSSDGIYPKPKITWDHQSESVPQTKVEPVENGLYSISSSLPLGPNPPQQFTCNVSTPTSWKSATYSLRPASSGSKVGLIVGVTLGILALITIIIGIAVKVLWKRGIFQKLLRKNHVEKLSEEQGELMPRGRSREDSCEISLDPNTAHRRLRLDKNTVTYPNREDEQQLENHEDNEDKDRFTRWEQVMSSTGLRGRCYWEVVWSRDNGIVIAVSYKGISREGDRSLFGENNQSWSLAISEGECTAVHNQQTVRVPGEVGVASGTVGVFLDCEAGVLSFYEVISGGKLRHLHTFNESFSEDLFPGFRLASPGSSVKLLWT